MSGVSHALFLMEGFDIMHSNFLAAAALLGGVLVAAPAFATDASYDGYNVSAPQSAQAKAAHEAARDRAGMHAALVLSGPSSGKASIDVPPQVGVNFAAVLVQQASEPHTTVKQLLAMPGAGTYGYSLSNMTPGRPTR